MTAAAFILNAMEHEREELVAYGLLEPPADPSQAERDAWASDLLRVLGEHERELAQMEESRRAEHARVDMRWDTNTAGLRKRAEVLRQMVCSLAIDADFGKKKSRDVAFGSYGRRQIPVKVAIVDDAAALDWAEKNQPHIVRLEATAPGDWVIANWEQMTSDMQLMFTAAKRRLSKTALNAYVKASGEEPPGVNVEPAHDEAFAKPAEREG